MTIARNNSDDYMLLYDSYDKSKCIYISTYENWAKQKNVDLISQFIYDRLYNRYLKMFDFQDSKYRSHFVSGFAIMANCCLLIETIESFYRGWNNSNGKSETAFLKFFTRDTCFAMYAHSDFPSIFYKDIRCSILHQGETSGGWKISCKHSKNPLDIGVSTIYAFQFHSTLKKSLDNYRTELLNCEWESQVWRSLRTKMKAIILNCKKEKAQGAREKIGEGVL
ncbi:MAG: hypothetical protein JW915_06690 [Chitinispirillaceae bacterium]|nr:hypothetical protein [Chitinispirillaceae bacterium]